MKSYHEALASILIDAGIRKREAFRICRLIEDNELGGLTSDDVQATSYGGRTDCAMRQLMRSGGG